MQSRSNSCSQHGPNASKGSLADYRATPEPHDCCLERVRCFAQSHSVCHNKELLAPLQGGYILAVTQPRGARRSKTGGTASIELLTSLCFRHKAIENRKIASMSLENSRASETPSGLAVRSLQTALSDKLWQADRRIIAESPLAPTSFYHQVFREVMERDMSELSSQDKEAVKHVRRPTGSRCRRDDALTSDSSLLRHTQATGTFVKYTAFGEHIKCVHPLKYLLTCEFAILQGKLMIDVVADRNGSSVSI